MSDNRTVTSAQARKSILRAFDKNRPLFLWGPPGIGKSELVESITAELGGHMIDLRLGQMEPTDIRGIPFYNKDTGKNVGDDFREGKITLPVVLSFRRGTQSERMFWTRTLEKGKVTDADLAAWLLSMEKRGSLLSSACETM